MARFGFNEPNQADFTDAKAWSKAKAGFIKSVSDSALYQQFVQQKLEKAQRASSEMGNLYTASIFLALMSTLESDLNEGTALQGKKLGFVAYGSGSKAKIFEATVAPEWKSVVAHFKIFEKLGHRQDVSYETYESLHKGTHPTSCAPEQNRWKLESIGTEGVTLGARYYSAFAG